KKGTTLFLMPGGKPKADETIEECLIREIHEEHQCALIPESISFFGEFEDIAANEPNTLVCIKLYLGTIVGVPQIYSEIEEQRWFGKEDNPIILSAIIKNKILPALLKRKII
ncbi:MAG: NUDIX domain-containing protein, partial [Nanoarchaeota archaeon]